MRISRLITVTYLPIHFCSSLKWHGAKPRTPSPVFCTITAWVFMFFNVVHGCRNLGYLIHHIWMYLGCILCRIGRTISMRISIIFFGWLLRLGCHVGFCMMGFNSQLITSVIMFCSSVCARIFSLSFLTGGKVGLIYSLESSWSLPMLAGRRPWIWSQWQTWRRSVRGAQIVLPSNTIDHPKWSKLTMPCNEIDIFWPSRVKMMPRGKMGKNSQM